MRASVAAAWPAFCATFEGVTSYMYLDVKGLVTTGVGFLIDSVAAAQALPWLRVDNTKASPGDISKEWHRVKAHTDWQHLNGLDAKWRTSASLHLEAATIDRLLLAKTADFWAHLARTLPKIETFPADAQLALIDEAWQNGPAFLDPGTVWTGTRAAVLAQDWLAAASHVPGTGRRADARKRLFSNAAAVVTLGLDPDVLWDQKVPTRPAEPTPTPDPTPEEPDVAKVKFRGGWTCSCVATSLPLVEKDMIRRGLIKYNIDIFQLGYRGGATGASKGTHDAGGCTDVAQRGTEFIKVWREWGWTMQDRSAAFPNDQHAHGWPYKCPHLAPAAEAQERDWDRKDAGLVGTGRVGGMWPIDDWKTAMKKRLAEQKKRDEQAAADAEAARKKKELELPTTAEVVKALTADKTFMHTLAKAVWDEDYIPNTVTGNTANEFVAPKTNLSALGTKVSTLTDKIDALAAAVAAAFPHGTPPAA